MPIFTTPDDGSVGGATATLAFDNVALLDRTDGTSLITQITSEWSSNYTVNATRDTYATGRKRVIRMPGSDQDRTVTFCYLHPDEVDWLRAKLGVILLFRDGLGRRFNGFYAALPISEIPLAQGYATSTVTFLEVDVVEGV